jgi:cell division protein FtsX
LGALLIVAVAAAGCTRAGASPSGAHRVGSISDPDVEIFMRVKATPGQIAAVRKVVIRSSAVREYTFMTHADALREYRRLYRDQPGLLSRATVDNLPTSFRVTLANGGTTRSLKRALKGMAGIDEIKGRATDKEIAKEARRRCAWWAKNPDAGDIEVFLPIGATGTQADAVRAEIGQVPSVESVHFVSEVEAVQLFRRQFADRPKLRDSVSAGQLPTSFRVRLRPGAEPGPLAPVWDDLDGVDQVTQHPFRTECAALAEQST